MSIPVYYNLRSLRQRPISTLATALGMALVVAVFVAMSAMSEGFRAALTETGSPDNVLLLRKGANQEMNSGLGRDLVSVLGSFPFVAKDSVSGLPMISPETYVVVSNNRRDNGGMANMVVRGVSLKAFEVRKGIVLTAGRQFRPGAREVVVGAGVVKRFPSTDLGDSLEFGGAKWAVVGQFSANGSAFESEVWGENEQFMPIFRGQVFQSITFRLTDPTAFDGVKKTLEDDPRMTVDAFQETTFYANQSEGLGGVLSFIGIFLAVIMSVGAIFGAINTMYAAVASRGPEIGVLLTLGFRPASVMSSFLLESIMISLLGGAIGCLMVLPLNGLVTSTTNFTTFSEIAFAFKITPQLLVTGMVFAALMGLLGGLLPARRAAKQQVVDALREA